MEEELQRYLDTAWQRSIDHQTILHLSHGPGCTDGVTSVGLSNLYYPVTPIFLHPRQVLSVLQWLQTKLSSISLPQGLLVTDLSIAVGTGEAVIQSLQQINRALPTVWLDHHIGQWETEELRFLAKVTTYGVVDGSGRESAASLLLPWLEQETKNTRPTFKVPATLRAGIDVSLLRRYATAVAARDTWHNPDDELGIKLGQAHRRLKEDYLSLWEAGELSVLPLLGARGFEQLRTYLTEAERTLVEHSPGIHLVLGPAPASDLAHRLWARDNTALLLICLKPDGNVSLRSRPGTSLAIKIAQAFHGGGHYDAAGVPIRSYEEPHLVTSLKDPRVEELVSELLTALKG